MSHHTHNSRVHNKTITIFGGVILLLKKQTKNNNSEMKMNGFVAAFVSFLTFMIFLTTTTNFSTVNAATTTTSAAALANITALLEEKVLYTTIATDAKKKMNDLESVKTMKSTEIRMIQLAFDSLSEEDKIKADAQIKTAQSHLQKVNLISEDLQWKVKTSDLAMSKIDNKIANVIGEVNPSLVRFTLPAVDGILVVKENFTIFGIGNNDYGNLGCGHSFTPMKTPCQTIDTGVLKGKVIWKIKAGGHTVILTTDNTLISFGYGDLGALGTGKLGTSNVPVFVNTGTLLNGKQVKDFEVGFTGTIVSTTDGQMFGWGANQYGELCLPVGTISSPTLLPTFTKKFKKMFYQTHTSIFITEDNEVYGCGRFTGAQTYTYYTKIDVSAINQTIDPIEEIAIASMAWVFRTKSGAVYSMGYNPFGTLGLGDTVDRGVPTLIPYFKNEGIQIAKLCPGPKHVFALSTTGKVYQWGLFSYFRYINNDNILSISPVSLSPFKVVGNDFEKYNIVDIICGGASVVAISDTGVVFGWGRSVLFGNGGTSSLVPTKLILP